MIIIQLNSQPSLNSNRGYLSSLKLFGGHFVKHEIVLISHSNHISSVNLFLVVLPNYNSIRLIIVLMEREIQKSLGEFPHP
jgi:hypothetical protein